MTLARLRYLVEYIHTLLGVRAHLVKRFYIFFQVVSFTDSRTHEPPKVQGLQKFIIILIQSLPTASFLSAVEGCRGRVPIIGTIHHFETRLIKIGCFPLEGAKWTFLFHLSKHFSMASGKLLPPSRRVLCARLPVCVCLFGDELRYPFSKIVPLDEFFFGKT